MSAYEHEPEFDRHEDAEARYARDREAEHLEHRASLRDERLREHVTPDPRPERRTLRRNQPPAERDFKDAVLGRDGCVVHGNPVDCTWPPRAHHCLPQQFMRRNGLGHLLWSPLAGLGVCQGAHDAHHAGSRPIRRDEIPAPVADFIEELGFGWYLDRHYPVTAVAA